MRAAAFRRSATSAISPAGALRSAEVTPRRVSRLSRTPDICADDGDGCARHVAVQMILMLLLDVWPRYCAAYRGFARNISPPRYAIE